MLFILSLIIIVLFLIYLKLKYFTLYGPIPGIPPQFLLGNLNQLGFLNGSAYHEMYATLKKRFGHTFQVWFGHMRFIVVTKLGDIQHIFANRNIYEQGTLFTEQLSVIVPASLIAIIGPTFKRHGAVTLPLFRRGKITSNFDLVVDCVDKLLDQWRVQSKNHLHTDIVQQSQNLLLQIFGLIAFDFDLGILNQDDNQHKEKNDLNQALDDILSVVNVVFYTPRLFSRIYLTLNPRYRRARTIVQKYIYRMIEQELGETDDSRMQRKRTSLIASLVGALQQDEKAEAMKREEDKKGLSRAEIFDEMIAFLIAGFETTSTALAWFIYAMSKNPQIQQKLKAELRDGNDRNDLSLDRLDSLTYLDCTINEVLRYYPPVEGTARTLTVDDRLPDSGFQLYKGQEILLPGGLLARDPEHWSIDPELFYPDRFLKEDKNHHPLAMFPFGYGHRQCIGQDLARFELKVIAARMMQYVTFIDGGTKVNNGGFINGLTVKPKNVGVIIQFDRME
ncbi:hypothetical protein I4U23_009106 [Adineta vaga]|nr:hypothetical protein I4U23_009106 [Adineta vaga]